MRLAAAVLLFASTSLAHVVVEPDKVITHHGEEIPRFGGTVVDGVTTVTGAQAVAFIEVQEGGSLVIEGELTTNTIVVLPGGRLEMKPGSALLFDGGIPDANGEQFGLGLICFGHFEAHGTPVPTWIRDGTEVDWLPFRDTVIRSLDQSAPLTRGHVMIAGEGTSNVEYVWYDGIGRTTVDPTGPENHIARYAHHYHHVMGQGSRRVHGCLFTHPLKWAGVIHGTHDTVWTDNVFVGDGESTGACLSVEDLYSTGNVITRNLFTNAIGIKDNARKNAGDGGHDGIGLWLRQEAASTIEDNVAVGCRFGFHTFTVKGTNQVALSSGEVLTKEEIVPASWERNTSIACDRGFESWDMQPFWVDNPLWRSQDCIDCGIGISSKGGVVRLHSSHISACDYALTYHRYNGVETSDVTIRDCSYASSGGGHFVGSVDIDDSLILLTGDAGAVLDIECNRVPNVVIKSGTIRNYNPLLLSQNRFLVTTGGKILEILLPAQRPDEPYPDVDANGGHLMFLDGETVGEVWAKCGIAPKLQTILPHHVVAEYPGITYRQSKFEYIPCPVIVHDERPVFLPREVTHVGRFEPENSRVWVFCPDFRSGDLMRLLVDGEEIASTYGLRIGLQFTRLPAIEGEVITVQHVRDGEILSEDSRRLDGPDPRLEELEQLYQQKAQLEASITTTQDKIAEVEDDLEFVQMVIAFLQAWDPTYPALADWIAWEQTLTNERNQLQSDLDKLVSELLGVETRIAELEEELGL